MTKNKTEAQAAGEDNKRQREFEKRLGFIGWGEVGRDYEVIAPSAYNQSIYEVLDYPVFR